MEQAVVTAAERRKARAAISALFFTNGALLGSLVLRFPEIKDAFGLSSSVYGATIALSSLGGILAGPFAARAVRRLTSRVVASVMTIGIGLAVLLIGLTSTLRIYAGVSPTVATILYIILASSFLLNGCSDSIVDVAQNMQGFRLQRLYGRPIISAFHGMWSVGAAVGGLFGVLTPPFHISLLIHSLIASCICIALGFAVMPFTIRGADPQDNNEDEAGDSSRVRTLSWHPVLVLTLLVILCISGMLIEDAGSSWATLFMRDYAHAGAGLAGSGYVVLLTTHACGRFIADSLVHRYGPRAVVCGGGALILIGMGSARHRHIPRASRWFRHRRTWMRGLGPPGLQRSPRYPRDEPRHGADDRLLAGAPRIPCGTTACRPRRAAHLVALGDKRHPTRGHGAGTDLNCACPQGR